MRDLSQHHPLSEMRHPIHPHHKYSLGFCECYSYPSVVTERLVDIADHVINFAGDNVSICLTGSGARGELSYYVDDANIRMLSDLEFWIFTGKAINRSQYQDLVGSISSWSRRVAPQEPLFHVDFGFIEKKDLTNLPLTLRTYETQINGKILYGEDLTEQFPAISLDNFDFRDLNLILVRRLRALLLYMPWQWISEPSRCDPYILRHWQYILARNALDLVTILLPYEGILIGNYHDRFSCFFERYEGFRCRTFLGDQFPPYIEICQACKFSPEKLLTHEEVVWLYSETIRYFITLSHHLLIRVGNANARLLSRLAFRGSTTRPYDLVPENYDLKHIHDFRSNSYSVFGRAVSRPFLQNVHRQYGFRRGAKAAWGYSHVNVLSFLLHMHRAVALQIGGNSNEARLCFEQAASVMQEWNLSDVDMKLPKPGLEVDIWRSLKVRFFVWYAEMRLIGPTEIENMQPFLEETW